MQPCSDIKNFFTEPSEDGSSRKFTSRSCLKVTNIVLILLALGAIGGLLDPRSYLWHPAQTFYIGGGIALSSFVGLTVINVACHLAKKRAKIQVDDPLERDHANQGKGAAYIPRRKRK